MLIEHGALFVPLPPLVIDCPSDDGLDLQLPARSSMARALQLLLERTTGRGIRLVTMPVCPMNRP
jgi:hypothetical protein